MSLPTELRQLIAHMEWADAALWSAALGTARVADDHRARELLHHIHEVQWAYLQLMRGQRVNLRDLGSFERLEDIRLWGHEYYSQLSAVLRSATPEWLQRNIEFPWAEQLAKRFGRVQPTDMRQALLQITSHSTYHRGQINTRIRELDGEPAQVDFIMWSWAGQPAASWGAPPQPKS